MSYVTFVDSSQSQNSLYLHVKVVSPDVLLHAHWNTTWQLTGMKHTVQVYMSVIYYGLIE